MQSIKYPYRHYIAENFFDPKPLALLRDFAAGADWDFFEDNNFPQYISRRKQVEDLFLHNFETGKELRYLLSEKFIKSLENLFSYPLRECVNISFHKLIKNCFNVVHNDSNSMGEKIRVVCYLSNSSDYEGGELNLFTLSNQNAPSISYKFNLNSAFIFAMNEKSVHSVSKVISGERICLVLTYQ